MSEPVFPTEESEIIHRMTRGRVAGEFLALNREAFDKLEASIFRRFSQIDPYNQKFDNSMYCVLSLELKVIREFRALLDAAVTDGDFAEQDLRSLNKNRS